MDEGTLKLECAKIQSIIHREEGEYNALVAQRDRQSATVEQGKRQLIAQEQARFEEEKVVLKKTIAERCAAKASDAETLLDTFPELEKKEFAGKYEVKAIDEKLSEMYPPQMLDGYVCTSPIEFDTEGEAYAAYTQLERKIARLKSGSFAATLFSGITSALETMSGGDGMKSKAGLVVAAMLMLSFVAAPFIYLGLFTVIGICAGIQGINSMSILRTLFSIKLFLNDSYDEDIFQEDRTNIMDSVNEFLEGIKQEYCEKVDCREFQMNPKILQDYDVKVKSEAEKLDVAIQVKDQHLKELRDKAAEMVDELDRLVAEREKAAQEAYSKVLQTTDWKNEWYSTLLIDVTADKRIIGCHWTQGNTLYLAKDIEDLQKFEQLAIYQSFLHMHPSICGQVVLDYKYMGGPLVPFSRLQTSIFEMATEKEAIDKRIERIKNDIRARTGSILQSCPSIEEFNKLMGTYDAPGESYVLVHLCGLMNLVPELLSFFKNGPRTGYYFKLYMTLEEFKNVVQDFPYDDFPEYAEVSTAVAPRTAAQVRRMAGIDS